MSSWTRAASSGTWAPPTLMTGLMSSTGLAPTPPAGTSGSPFQPRHGQHGARTHRERVLETVGRGEHPPAGGVAVVAGADPVEGLAGLDPVHPVRLGRARGGVLGAERQGRFVLP